MTVKKYSTTEKLKIALEAIKGELTHAQISSKYSVHSTQINRWKQQAHQGMELGFSNNKQKIETDQEALIEQLYQQIGKLTTECEWLKKKSKIFNN